MHNSDSSSKRSRNVAQYFLLSSIHMIVRSEWRESMWNPESETIPTFLLHSQFTWFQGGAPINHLHHQMFQWQIAGILKDSLTFPHSLVISDRREIRSNWESQMIVRSLTSSRYLTFYDRWEISLKREQMRGTLKHVLKQCLDHLVTLLPPRARLMTLANSSWITGMNSVSSPSIANLLNSKSDLLVRFAWSALWYAQTFHDWCRSSLPSLYILELRIVSDEFHGAYFLCIQKKKSNYWESWWIKKRKTIFYIICFWHLRRMQVGNSHYPPHIAQRKHVFFR